MDRDLKLKIENLKNRYSLLEEATALTTLKKTGNLYRGLCPFHHEKTPSFFVYMAQEKFHCFGCGVSGDVLDLFALRDGLPVREVLSKLLDVSRDSIEKMPIVRDQAKVYEEYLFSSEQINKTISALWNPSHKLAIDTVRYLVSRVSVPTMKRFNLGLLTPHLCNVMGLHANLSNRISFPIYHEDTGECVGFVCRKNPCIHTDDETSKYMLLPNFQRSRFLYGEHRFKQVRFEDRKRMFYSLLVEGPLDVLKCYESGYYSTVAMLGTTIVTPTLERLKRRAERNSLMLVAVFDGDEAGKRAADKLKEKVITVILPDGEDPNTCLQTDEGKIKFASLLDDATSSVHKTHIAVSSPP